MNRFLVLFPVKGYFWGVKGQSVVQTVKPFEAKV